MSPLVPSRSRCAQIALRPVGCVPRLTLELAREVSRPKSAAESIVPDVKLSTITGVVMRGLEIPDVMNDMRIIAALALATAVAVPATVPSSAPLALSSAVPVSATVAVGSTHRYAVPTRAPLSRRFIAPPHRYGPGHRGVDFAARAGTVVLAPARGIVTFNGVVAGRPLVVIEHPDLLRSTLEAVDSSLPPGTHLARGDPVGKVASGHACAEAAECLHWGVRLTDGTYIDPLILLYGARVRLYG